MRIHQATDESDWTKASKILFATIQQLNKIGKPLWTEYQISVTGLRNTYQLEELYFFTENEKIVGVVFLQNSDIKFWPELTNGNSLFFHKLAIHPKYSGLKFGSMAIRLIVDHTKKSGFKWVRLDCDNRIELLKFYKSNGFVHVCTETFPSVSG